MARLVDLLDEMADAVRAVMDASDLAVQVEPRMIINPTPPTIDMWPANLPRDEELASFGETAADMAGAKVFTVRARIGTADADAGQDFLLAVMDEEDELSIAAALHDDQTLNGYAAQVIVDGGRGYTLFPNPEGTAAWLGTEWLVTVLDVVS